MGLYNDTLHSRTTPHSWKEARVVSIYKGKGTDTDASNYCPISLLNVTYKFFAAMLQSRLAQTCEAKLRRTQHGFRPQRSTVHPIFVLRRAMEWSNMTARPLNFLFLDWKQAVDSLDHTAMIIALKGFGLASDLIDIILSLYTDATFTVMGRSDQTATGKVSSGIRQGCPLSPYLFIIALSVIFEDLDGVLLDKGIPTNTWSEGNPIYDLEYADDTLLMSLTTPQLQNFLQELEGEASLYGMSLNTTKTELLAKPDHTATIYFRNGEPVSTTESAKYLGLMVSWNKPADTAIAHRAALAETGYKKLRLVWNSSPLVDPKKFDCSSLQQHQYLCTLLKPLRLQIRCSIKLTQCFIDC